MENLIVTNFLSGQVVALEYKAPVILIFFTMKEVYLVREINKDIRDTLLTGLGVYIGKDPNSVYEWTQKEPGCMDSYYGGVSLAPWSLYNINELPWVLVFHDNTIVLSCKFSDIQRPVIKNILKKLPNLKKPKNKPPETVDQILSAIDLSTEQKIDALERISLQSSIEMQSLTKEIEQKDKIIKDIMYKLDVYSGSRPRKKIQENIDIVEKASEKNEEDVKESEIDSLEEQISDNLLPKSLWIMTIANNKPQLPPIQPIKTKSNKLRSRSSVVSGSNNKSYIVKIQ